MIDVETYITIGDLKFKPNEPVSHRRDVFWPWEYWAVKEHMAMNRCDTWSEYVIKVVMACDMPALTVHGASDIECRPTEEDAHRNIIIRIPLKIMEAVNNRQRALGRKWREFLLYPALQENLIIDHYREITKQADWAPCGER